MERPPKNTVKLQDGIIFVVQSGDQTFESLAELNDKIRKLSKGLDAIKILVDYRGVGKADLGARRAAFDIARHMPFDKMAFFGASPYMAGLINLLARSAGRKHALYFAKDEKGVRAWLK